MIRKLKDLKSRNSEQGFTIIEVMIVLAIAGLILLIVFLAVPALQRSSRNTQRKNDSSAILSSIANYVSNNNGTLPTAATFANSITDAKLGFYTAGNVFFGNNTNIPTSASNGASGASATTLTTENAIFFPGTTCNGNQPTVTGASARAYSLMYAVETGSSATPQCIGS